MKGYRTIILNAATLLGALAAGVMLYVDQLGLSSETTAWLGLGAVSVSAATNFILRFKTTTPVGQKE